MRNCRLLVWLLATLPCASVATAQPIHPGKTGTELEALVRSSHSPNQVLSYQQAKVAMFTKVDNHGGKVRLLYTGDSISTTTVPHHTFVNAEHVWPQSRFGKTVGRKKSDLHHIFPAYSTVNNDRSNHPFGDIPDTQTNKWWAGCSVKRSAWMS